MVEHWSVGHAGPRAPVNGFLPVPAPTSVLSAPDTVEFDRPSSARVYDYLLGGHTNFPADRAAAEQGIKANPASRTPPRENRAVRFLAAERGIDQFLDIGTGIPSAPNVHHVAQQVNPAARVVYVENDPLVLTHARALLTSTTQGKTAYLDADLKNPDAILADPVLRATLNLSQPVALMLVWVLHFITDETVAHRSVRTLLDALPVGSYLVLSHATNDFMPAAAVDGIAAADRATRIDFGFRTREQTPRLPTACS